MIILQYRHVLIIFSEDINTFVHGLGHTKGNIEILVIKQKVTLVLDPQRFSMKNV